MPGATVVWPPEWESENAAAASIRQMLMLGALATTVTAEDLSLSLDRAVDLLRQAFGARDCEIFLREPDSSDAILTACSGPDSDVLGERDRFPVGRGFPGIVIATGKPMLTQSILLDERFLRRTITERGIRSYVCAPLPGLSGPLGCVGLGWRRSDVPLQRVGELLSQAAGSIGTTVRAGLFSALESVDRALGELAHKTLEAPGKSFLQAIARTRGVRSATLVLNAQSRGEDATVLSTGPKPCLCQGSFIGGKLHCPLLASGRGKALGACRDKWPAPCRKLPASVSTPCCVPLMRGNHLAGVVVVDYGDKPPTPITHDLVPLLTMARAGGARLMPASEGSRPGYRVDDGQALELQCFGGFDVRLGGQAIPPETFARKKALTLLKSLVLKAGNPISRDALVERLWPGAGQKAGANRLHGVVHALRSAIEPFRDERRWIYICNQGELYYLNMESPHWIDVFAFRRLEASAHDAARSGRLEDAIAQLDEGVAIYRGDLFEDDPYASWCTPERTDLRHRYLDMLLRLAELCFSTDQSERGVDYLRRGLLKDPFREDFHQALIQTLMDLGRRREALQQYRECARLLREELGTEPLPATRRLERFLVS